MWVIDQAKELFDQVHVLIGKNPYKTPFLKEEFRLETIKESLSGNVHCVALGDRLVTDYVNRLSGTCKVTVVRSVRNSDDFYYEHSMFECMSEKVNGSVTFLYYHAPQGLLDLSSTKIKECFKQDMWGVVSAHVPSPVYKKMLDVHFHGLEDIQGELPELYASQKARRDEAYGYLERKKGRLNKGGGSDWIVLTPEVASIFDTASAGLSPAEGFPGDDRLSMQQSVNGHTMVMVDHVDYNPSPHVDKVRTYFDKAVDAQVITPAKRITHSQVKDLLDGDDTVIYSLDFHLMKVPVGGLKCVGQRHQPHTTSVGPVVVDRSPFHWDHGEPCVIEGKHRYMDAVERCEKTIWAWVGDEALSFFTPPSASAAEPSSEAARPTG